MGKSPLSIKLISLLGIGCGVYNVVNSFEPVFLALGIVAIILSIGLFALWNIARIISIFFSVCLIAFYALLTVIYIQSGSHFSWGVGLVVYFPIFLWSLLVVIFCNLPKIKNKFHSFE